jgi:hypothetical protein
MSIAAFSNMAIRPLHIGKALKDIGKATGEEGYLTATKER